MIIYVLPSEPGQPPRAVLGEVVENDDERGVAGALATWSSDSGCWMLSDGPVPDEIGEQITDHAKSLGVEW